MPDRLTHRPSALGFGVLIALLVILLDQATKLWVLNTFVPGESVTVTPFSIWCWSSTRVRPSVFWPIIRAGSAGFTAIALGISAWIVWQLRTLQPRTWFSLGLALIMGGALGNLIDRLWLGMVIDFIDLHVAGYHWPAFNVADSAVCVGAVLYVLCQSRTGEPKESTA